MRFNCLSCQATHPAAAMIRISTGLRSINVRAVVNSLLVKQLPSPLFSSADYYSSTIALRDRKEHLSFTERHRNPTYTSPASAPAPLLDVSAGGGPRPKKPRVWKTKTKRGSVARSENLLDVVHKLSNTKEEVYGMLDAWIAWDLEFPLIAVKKALKTLKEQEEWRRIIQVSKWMLDKGQGKTLATYQLLLQAFDHEGRIEEAQILWDKLLRDNQDCLPRIMFSQMIAMYDRYDKKKEILKVFTDMEELQVKPDSGTAAKVARAYSHFGYHEMGQELLERRNMADTSYHYSRGKRVGGKRQSFRDKASMVESWIGPGLQTNGESQKRLATETSVKSESAMSDTSLKQEERPKLESSYEHEEKPKLERRYGPEEQPRLETSKKSEEGPRFVVTGDKMKERPTFETYWQEKPKFETKPDLKERPRFAVSTQLKSDEDMKPSLT